MPTYNNDETTFNDEDSYLVDDTQDTEASSLLTSFDEDFDEAEVIETEFETIPDGKYQVTIDKVELKVSKEKKTPMLFFQLKILAGGYKGKMIFKNSLITKNSLQFLKKDLLICGLQLKKFSDLENELDKLLDINLNVEQKTKPNEDPNKDPWISVYFQKKLDINDDSFNFGNSEKPVF